MNEKEVDSEDRDYETLAAKATARQGMKRRVEKSGEDVIQFQCNNEAALFCDVNFFIFSACCLEGFSALLENRNIHYILLEYRFRESHQLAKVVVVGPKRKETFCWHGNRNSLEVFFSCGQPISSFGFHFNGELF